MDRPMLISIPSRHYPFRNFDSGFLISLFEFVVEILFIVSGKH